MTTQKRARPSAESADGARNGSRGVDQRGKGQPEARASKAGGASLSPADARRAKGSKAKRRKAAAAVAASAESERVDSREVRSATTSSETVCMGPPFVTGRSVMDTVVGALEQELSSLKALAVRTRGLFEWVDGPLVTAMRNGELLLLDELSLAEDAVLERLNSVLEPGRSITLAEKGGEGAGGDQGAAQTVVAAPGFRWEIVLRVACMACSLLADCLIFTLDVSCIISYHPRDRVLSLVCVEVVVLSALDFFASVCTRGPLCTSCCAQGHGNDESWRRLWQARAVPGAQIQIYGGGTKWCMPIASTVLGEWHIHSLVSMEYLVKTQRLTLN